MAYELVNYSCGHSERAQFYGKQSERDRKHAWMEKGLCPVCYAKEKEENRAIEAQKATEEAESKGLPKLIGSEKQVSWAETIRKNALISTGNVLKPRELIPEEILPSYEKLVEAYNVLLTESSAKWWIDNRGIVDIWVTSVANKIE